MTDPIIGHGGFRPGLAGFFVGMYSVFWGLRRLSGDRDLRRLALLPLLLTLILYGAMIAVIWFGGPRLLEWFWTRPDGGWTVYLWYAALVALGLLVFVVLALFFTAIAEAVGGPFYDKMAVHVLEGHRISVKEPGLIEGTIPDLIRSVLFLIPALLCAVLGLIPGIGIVFWVVGTAIAWLGFASAAVNPALMITGHGLGERVGYLFKFFFNMLGIGAVVGVSLLIPLLGLLAIPASIIGSSELYAESRVVRGREM